MPSVRMPPVRVPPVVVAPSGAEGGEMQAVEVPEYLKGGQCRGESGGGGLLGARTAGTPRSPGGEELAEQSRPLRVVVGAVQVQATEAGAPSGDDEGTDDDARLGHDDGQVRDVGGDERVGAARVGNSPVDEDDEVRTPGTVPAGVPDPVMVEGPVVVEGPVEGMPRCRSRVESLHRGPGCRPAAGPDLGG
jgi:hypothetical protein